jgi:hypothetical protein
MFSTSEPAAHTRKDEFRTMKVVDGLSGGIDPGTTVSLAEMGLPVKGVGGALLVFWKST